jgi:hypothetical protein
VNCSESLLKMLSFSPNVSGADRILSEYFKVSAVVWPTSESRGCVFFRVKPAEQCCSLLFCSEVVLEFSVYPSWAQKAGSKRSMQSVWMRNQIGIN